jgi:hypothetical protein
VAEVDVGAVHDVLHVRFKELQKVRAVRGGDAGAFLELLEQWRCDLEIDERDCTPYGGDLPIEASYETASEVFDMQFHDIIMYLIEVVLDYI